MIQKVVTLESLVDSLMAVRCIDKSRLTTVLVVACCITFSIPATAGTDRILVQDLPIEQFQIIKVAMPEFLGRVSDVNGYKLSVFETETEYIVLFSLPSDPLARGCPGDKPCVEVYLEKLSLKVIRTIYSR